MEKLSIHYAFKINPYVVFEVSYYRLGSNRNKHFSTSASQFNKPKTDYNQCGQAQDSLLPRNSKAYNFYKNWDAKHTQDLSNLEYSDLLCDLKNLESFYLFEVKNGDNGFSFSELKELSKRKT